MKSILWLEDERDQFRAFSRGLINEYELTRARDYQEALDIFLNGKNKYDMIIVDIIIPSGHKFVSVDEIAKISTEYFGVKFIKEVRQINKEVPILVVSVVNEDDIIDNIKEIDNDIDLIWKYDTDSNQVKETVNNILEKQFHKVII
ncbi:MAG: hypothetical protein ACOC6D_06385 [Atribacterota bacterium]